MKAMLLTRYAPIENRPLRLSDAPQPKLEAHQILVHIHCSAICRTDLHLIEGELPQMMLPIIPGHQVVGIVEKLGASCRRFKPGQRVGIAWLRHTCGRCEFCRTGRENLCIFSRYTGYHEHGGYAEFAVVDEDFAYAIPQDLSDEEAAPLLCAGIIGYRALKRCNLPTPGRLGIFGFGSSAHITTQVAIYQGSQVYVATRSRSHQELARRLGASWVGDTCDSFPELVDGAIVFAPVGQIVPYALRAVKKGGTVVLAGIYMTPIPQLDYEPHLFHEKNLCSVEANTRQDGEELLQIASQAGIKPTITTFGLAEANEALIRLKHDQLNGTGVLTVAGS